MVSRAESSGLLKIERGREREAEGGSGVKRERSSSSESRYLYFRRLVRRSKKSLLSIVESSASASVSERCSFLKSFFSTSSLLLIFSLFILNNDVLYIIFTLIYLLIMYVIF